MEEQIAESDLLDVFDHIKGPLAKQRSYINIEDFTAAVHRYKPALLVNQEEGDTMQTGFKSKIEDLFRNICETVCPTVEPTSPVNDADQPEPHFEEQDNELSISTRKKLK